MLAYEYGKILNLKAYLNKYEKKLFLFTVTNLVFNNKCSIKTQLIFKNICNS